MAKKPFETVKKMFETSVLSQTYRTWRQRSKICREFFDGVQWTSEEVAALTQRGQVPVVINKTRNRVKGLAGTEIVGRTRIAYGPRKLTEMSESTADALSMLALLVQDKTDSVHIRSKAFEDSLVEGIGAHMMDSSDGSIGLRHVSPRDVFWDMSDQSPFLTDSVYRGFKSWQFLDNLVLTYPDKKTEISELVGGSDAYDYSSPLGNTSTFGTSDYVDIGDRVTYIDKSAGRVLVVELEYRQKERAFEYVNSEGKLILTFDQKEALKGRISKEDARNLGAYGITYRELIADRYYTCQFAGDVELYHAPSEIEFKPDFDLQLLCLDKTELDNVPTGLVYWALDPQKELNKRRSKMLHHLNSARIVADSDAFDNIERVRAEAARPDAVIVKKKGTEAKIEFMTDMAKGQFDVMNLADREIQDTLGIYDDLLGRETNATSGVAIQKRQNSSMKQQAPQFDKFKLFTKKFGELLLAYMQYTYQDEQVLAIVGDDGLAKSVILNAPARDKEGQIITDHNNKPVMVNDIKTGMFDVYVKETSDVASYTEDSLERLSQMLMNGVQPSVMTMMAAGFTKRQATELMQYAAPQQQGQVLPVSGQAPEGQAQPPQGQPQQ